jgi:site-specific DNA recombinase
MRAVIYARYSSDLQSAASIEDQVRLCRVRIEREGWSYLTAYADRALSGASRLRPGYQRLLADARQGGFDVIVAEALDRLSRDQEDVAALYKQLSFAGVKLVTLSEGEISELHVGLKGTMNALFLKDLAAKTHRGLRGRVEQGRSGGGLCYGYGVVRETDRNGAPVHGGRKIVETEADVVRGIFTEFAAGRSPRAIAKSLNTGLCAGPHGKPWGPSTIYGNWRRGTGILNNELYVGRLVWNRQRFVKDPQSGKRIAKPNPPDQWIVQEVPALRIVDDALWHRVKARQKAVRAPLLARNRPRPCDARRPRYLFSGLLRCGACGAGYIFINRERYGCAGARNRGTCANHLTIRRDVLEESVLAGLKEHLMAPELVKEFIAEFHKEVNRIARECHGALESQRSELGQVTRQTRSIIEAIKAGLFHASMKAEMDALEARKVQLEKELAVAEAPPVRLHPNLAEIYRQKVAGLRDALNAPDTRDEAAEALRSLIEHIKLTPEDGALKIELFGELGAILALAHSKKPGLLSEAGLVEQVKLVAGAGFEPTTFRL